VATSGEIPRRLHPARQLSTLGGAGRRIPTTLRVAASGGIPRRLRRLNPHRRSLRAGQPSTVGSDGHAAPITPQAVPFGDQRQHHTPPRLYTRPPRHLRHHPLRAGKPPTGGSGGRGVPTTPRAVQFGDRWCLGCAGVRRDNRSY
jgi:hypothetical protein